MYKVGAILIAAALGAASSIGNAAAAEPVPAQACPGHPDALGTSRVIEVSADQYSRLGTLQYPQTLPLANHEVVITFDDGPLPPWSNKILETLAAQCVKVTYFIVGEMARAYPDVVRREFAEGHAIGIHSQTHPLHFERLSPDRLAYQIDGAIDSIADALGDRSKIAPFFRIPGLARSNAVEAALAERGLVVFSVDLVADDWHRHITSAQIVQRAISRLERRGSGILLLHDIHAATAAALPELLKQLKERGFHVVQAVPAPAAPLVAGSPKPIMVASAMPEDGLLAAAAAAPAWPHAGADAVPDDITLPAPDETAFDIDYTPAAGLADLSATADWPSRAEITPAAANVDLPAPGLADIGVTLAGRKVVGENLGLRPSVDLPAMPVHAKLPHKRMMRAHHPARAHAGNDGQRAGLLSGLPTLAGLLKPAH